MAEMNINFKGLSQRAQDIVKNQVDIDGNKKLSASERQVLAKIISGGDISADDVEALKQMGYDFDAVEARGALYDDEAGEVESSMNIGKGNDRKTIDNMKEYESLKNIAFGKDNTYSPAQRDYAKTLILKNPQYRTRLENEGLIEDNSALQAENDTLQTKNQVLSEENQMLLEENQKLKEEVETYQKAAEDAENALEETKEELVQLKEKYAEQSSKLSELANEISDMSKTISEGCKELKKMSQRTYISPKKLHEMMKTKQQELKKQIMEVEKKKEDGRNVLNAIKTLSEEEGDSKLLSGINAIGQFFGISVGAGAQVNAHKNANTFGLR